MSDENSLPKTCINKLIKDYLSNMTRISSDFREVIAICGVEFIRLIATQAKEVADKGNKKTLNADHILTALKDLGFEGYHDELTQLVEDYKQTQVKKPRGPEIPHEEQLKKQNEIFENASRKIKEIYGVEQYNVLMSSLDKTCGCDDTDDQFY